jgi:hypothetical protein
LLDASPEVDLSALESPPDKVIAETALLLRAVFAIPAHAAAGLFDQAHDLARRLVPHARSLRVQVHVAMHPALARDYSLAHRCLAAIGYPNPEFETVLQKALSAPQAAGRERLPHRELEQAWIESLDGRQKTDDLIRRTALGQGVDVLTGSRDDIYALTHATLYATDLGIQTIELPRPATTVLREAESALAGALDDDDFDLAGEVVLMWPMLRLRWSTASQFGLAFLAAVEDEVGLLPSLAIDARTLRQHSGPARRQVAIATTYHTAYVMGLLCATVLRTSRDAEAPVETERRPNVLREALVALDQLPRRTHWEPHFRALPRRQQEMLASFVLDVAIRRAARQMALGILHRLVLTACEDEVATEAVAQGIELLDRVRSLDLGATGLIQTNASASAVG